MVMPSKAELEAMRIRCHHASPGPWFHHQGGTGYDWVGNAAVAEQATQRIVTKDKIHGHSADFAFIAHARGDLPRCLEALDEAALLLWRAVSHLPEELRHEVRGFLGALPPPPPPAAK